MASSFPTTSAASSISTAVATPAVSSASAAAAYAFPDDLPTTQNHYIASLGEIALYNPTLLLAAAALLQHTAVFGILFFLRGFSPKKVLDLHCLTIVFALSFVAAPIVFLVDLRIDQTKLLFFLEHEAVKFLIAIRALAPRRFVAERSGAIVLVCWCGLVAVTIPVVWNEQIHHAADIVAWSAFVSDFLIGTSELALAWRWRTRTPESSFVSRKMRAEALAGLGFMPHGESKLNHIDLIEAEEWQVSLQCQWDPYSPWCCTTSLIRRMLPTVGRRSSSRRFSLWASLFRWLAYSFPEFVGVSAIASQPSRDRQGGRRRMLSRRRSSTAITCRSRPSCGNPGLMPWCRQHCSLSIGHRNTVGQHSIDLPGMC